MLALFTSALSQKALVIVPDYEGYGSTVACPHPYLNRELTAEQVVTGAKAGLSWFESEVSHMAEAGLEYPSATHRVALSRQVCCATVRITTRVRSG